MKAKFFLLGAASLLLASCSNELDVPVDQAVVGGGTIPLSINVLVNPTTKAQVTGTNLPKNSDLGVFVTKSDGSAYSAKNPYNNIKYTGTGESYADTWTVDPSTPVYLNIEKATAYAYYPHQASGVSLTSIPITNDGTDWMYSSKVENLDFQNATAPFSMQHAMSIIRIKIERVNASDYGTISKVTIDGNGWATGATLNLKEGTIGDYTGENSQLVKTDVGSLGASALTYDHWVVPTGNTTDIMFKVTLDDNIFKSTLASVTLLPGKVYNYKLTVSNTAGLAINAVTITDWGDEPEENVETEFYKTIYTWEEAKAVDGVYGMMADGRAMVYEVATTTENLIGVAFVVNGKAYQVAKADATGYNEATTVNWWKNSPQDIQDLTNYHKADNTNTDGYLPKADGSWGGSTHLDADWTKWPTYNTATAALSDFNGMANTELIIAAQTTEGVVQDYTLAQAIVNFRGNPSVNDSNEDWFCPALGELAFMFLQKDKLNTLLNKVSGTEFSTGVYWSSSEYSFNYAWYVSFSNGNVYGYSYKSTSYRVRLVRAI